jgi:hypothetical protein
MSPRRTWRGTTLWRQQWGKTKGEPWTGVALIYMSGIQ